MFQIFKLLPRWKVIKSLVEKEGETKTSLNLNHFKIFLCLTIFTFFVYLGPRYMYIVKQLINNI